MNATRFGRSVSGAGDINRDGYPDLIVGAITDTAGGENAGRVFVYSGADGSELFNIIGEIEGGFFGETVSGGRDINADGVPDN